MVIYFFEWLKEHSKAYVYDIYFDLVEDAKDYDRINKNKMIEVILRYYLDYEYIAKICNSVELEYLKMVLDTKYTVIDIILSNCKIVIPYFDKKYDGVRKSLADKLLIVYELSGQTFIFEDLKPVIIKAIDKSGNS